MELWFLMALGGALFSGLSAFTLKIVAKHNFDSQLSVLHGAIFSLIWTTVFALFITGIKDFPTFPFFIMAFGGIFAGMTAILKIHALRHIDTTIYFPLFKLVSPALAVLFGIIFFQESFSHLEWLGIILSLFVPLMLITRSEHRRQNNLLAGLVLILITGIVAALVATINKYATNLSSLVFWLADASALGVVLGAFGLIIYKKGITNISSFIKENTNKKMFWVAIARGVLIQFSFLMSLYAFVLGGTLGVVQTIHSLYILVPIVLAIIFYKEHWNLQKVIAIVLSVAALILLA